MITLILYYICLLAALFLIFRNAYTGWKINKDFTLPICTLILFYFTLEGALIFPLDSFLGFKGDVIGLHYVPMFEKLFVVNFDGDYILSCFYYVLFILVFQYVYLFIVRRSIQKNNIDLNQKRKAAFELLINPYFILILSLSLASISFYILRAEIYYAISHEKSIYIITRSNTSKYYTIHQLANEFCVMVPFLAYTFTILKSNNYNITISQKRSAYVVLLITCIVVCTYISLLGNRREILSGLVLCILISINQFKNIHFKRLVFIFMMALTFFLANNFFRSRVIPKALNAVLHLEARDLTLKDEEFTAKGIAGSVIFSNELFYAHFSMYGAIHKHVALTHGSSLVYLAAAFIPRAIYPNRPPDIYSYYAKEVGAVPGQIYTLHHATAWYLNFGLIGIIVGACLLAFVFAFAFYLNFFKFKKENSFFVLLKSLLPFLLCAQIVTFITAGPEAYKALIFEGVLIPIILFRLCMKKQLPQDDIKTK